MSYSVNVPDQGIKESIQHKIDFKTKPLGALGYLEELALKIARVQQSESPTISKPKLLVFAADHGIASEGVSAYPQEVTFQMVLNFLNGGAAINVFCRQNEWGINIIDAGVIGIFEEHEVLINGKIAHGTRSFLTEHAMTNDECDRAIGFGRELAKSGASEGTNLLACGEMGIGNTSSAAVIMHVLSKIPLAECVGAGTGLDQDGRSKKLEILEKAVIAHGTQMTAKEALIAYGGYEIAMMCGAFIGAAESGILFMVDGFIASSAYLVAKTLVPELDHYAIFSHRSNEKGHTKMLEYLNARPLLDLDLRLGEGTGCAMALPIVKSAVNFLNEMASFDTAGVSNKED